MRHAADRTSWFYVTLAFRWVNTMVGNLKMALRGTYHSIDHAKYADRYLA
jgi:hypothetical protein